MNRPALCCLTEQQVTQFKLNGFLVVEDVLSTEEITDSDKVKREI